MKKIVACCLFSIILLLPISGLAKKKKHHFGEIKGEKGVLLINFQINDLFQKKVIQGLQKGMTAAIEYQIQLWKERPHWADQLVAEEIIRMKVNFDNWERRYVLDTPREEPRLLNEDRIREQCSQLIDFPLAPLEKLVPGSKYTVAVKAILQPMSIESYQEIKRWLAGEVKEINPKAIKSSKSPGKKAGNWLLGLVLNLTGFGDRVITAKSSVFTWRDGAVVFDKKR